MKLTNGQLADLIDALKVAIDDRRSMIRSNLPPIVLHWKKSEWEDFEEWTGQLLRFRRLRRTLLKENES
jgi:hypothetical protein